MLHISYCCISDTVTVEIFWITGENLFFKSQVRIFSLIQDWEPFFEWWRNFLNLKWKYISWITNKNLWLGYQLEKKRVLKIFLLFEKCPNTEFFLVRIFPHSDWIRKDTPYIFVFSPNARKYGPERAPYLDTFHAVSFRIQSECEKIQKRKNSIFERFSHSLYLNFFNYMTLSWLKKSSNQWQKIWIKLVTYNANSKELIYRDASEFLWLSVDYLLLWKLWLCYY